MFIDDRGRKIYRGQEALVEGRRHLREGRKLHYKTKFQNLPISIENRKGSVRSGTDKDGDEWRTKYKIPYGYIPGTKGVDGDELDVFVGADENAAYAYVVHCNTPDGKRFDEDKVMLGFSSSKSAKQCFLQHYDSPKFFGGVDTIPMWEFRERIWKRKHTTKKLVASRNGAHSEPSMRSYDDGQAPLAAAPIQLVHSFYSDVYGSKMKHKDIEKNIDLYAPDESAKPTKKKKSKESFVKRLGTLGIRESAEGGPGSGRHPEVLYHGTTKDAAEKIKQSGLKLQKMDGQAVSHVTSSKDEAIQYAGKDGAVVVLKPEAAKFFDSGDLGQEYGKSNARVSNKARIHSKYVDKIEHVSNKESSEGGPGSGPQKQNLDKEIDNLVKTYDVIKDPAGRKVIARRLDKVRDKLLNREADEHGVAGQKWGIRHARNDGAGQKGFQAKYRALANDPKTMNMMQVVHRSQAVLDAIAHRNKPGDPQQPKQPGQKPKTTHENHNEALEALKELGWKALEVGAALTGTEGALGVVRSVVKSPKGQKLVLNTDKAGNHKLTTDKHGKIPASKPHQQKRTRASMREAKTYFARSLATYGSESEADDIDAIRESFGDRVSFPKTKKHDVLGMGYFHKKINASKRVVLKPARKNRLTAGVFSEAVHALKRKIPVYAIRKGKMQRVHSVEALNKPNQQGHFGRIIYKKEKG